MQIDIKSVAVEPVRHTYSHVARRLGKDKPASRYQEGTFDVQATRNFHYRPTWQPQYQLYDPARTAIVMEDWYRLPDPRQYYYGTYVGARAKQQEAAAQNFDFVEKRGLAELVDQDLRTAIVSNITPLRHYEWGAHMNNNQICSMGYGTALTAAACYQAADRLGMAQYITRIALLWTGNDVAVVDQAKKDWLEAPQWQGLRKLVEDSLVVEDWFELFLAQNLVMDAYVHPLFFSEYERDLDIRGATAHSMLTEFMNIWYGESVRWVDSVVKSAAGESDANKTLLKQWSEKWSTATKEAIRPLAEHLLGDGENVLAQLEEALLGRLKKSGIQQGGT